MSPEKSPIYISNNEYVNTSDMRIQELQQPKHKVFQPNKVSFAKRDLTNNQILNRKISTVLEASPLKNSYIGKIFHDRYQNHLQ